MCGIWMKWKESDMVWMNFSLVCARCCVCGYTFSRALSVLVIVRCRCSSLSLSLSLSQVAARDLVCGLLKMNRYCCCCISTCRSSCNDNGGNESLFSFGRSFTLLPRRNAGVWSEIPVSRTLRQPDPPLKKFYFQTQNQFFKFEIQPFYVTVRRRETTATFNQARY
jgi:hypothetical protein